MMAKTFDKVFEEQEQSYNYVFARVVLSVDLDQGAIPAPISVLRAPWKLAAGLSRMLAGLMGKASGRVYTKLDGDGNSKPLSSKPLTLKHCSGRERLKRLTQIDMDGDTVAQDTFEKVTELVERVSKIEKEKSEEDDADEAIGRVRVYDGFEEHASRILFHYGDMFQHLAKRPLQLTILKEGNIENELQELPVKPGDDPNDTENEKLVQRALTAFPFPQSMDQQMAVMRLRDPRYLPHMADFVFERENETYGVVHTWPVKYNDEWKKTFKCTTENPDPSLFHPQAVAEFGETMCKLFGKDAVAKSPIIYSQRAMRNDHEVFVGTPDQLEAFLRRNPLVCDKLNIAKLYPGGFVTIYVNGKGDTGFKHFDFQPGVEQALYTKKGWETMACIKPMHLFVKDCILGADITLTWNTNGGGTPGESAAGAYTA